MRQPVSPCCRRMPWNRCVRGTSSTYWSPGYPGIAFSWRSPLPVGPSFTAACPPAPAPLSVSSAPQQEAWASDCRRLSGSSWEHLAGQWWQCSETAHRCTESRACGARPTTMSGCSSWSCPTAGTPSWTGLPSSRARETAVAPVYRSQHRGARLRPWLPRHAYHLLGRAGRSSRRRIARASRHDSPLVLDIAVAADPTYG